MKETPANSFEKRLAQAGVSLQRDTAHTLQINTGLLCDLKCRHCHLSAGPERTEVMSRKTMEQVIAYARHNRFATIDITGGAPELVPHIEHLIAELAPLTPNLMLRTNLTALSRPDKSHLLDLFREHKVILIASFPSTNEGQLSAQRGNGTMAPALKMLKKLNDAGYGVEESGLVLNLAANPAGAYMPSSQEAAERKFKHDLARKWGLHFNNLFIFANTPLGRFADWLESSGNRDAYIDKLQAGFNPCTLNGLMCRTLLSVAWDGSLYDCDFNQAANLPLGGKPTHINELEGLPERGTAIAVGEHCFACTAGSGFT
jgi:radical SAM/Cys-rich protein